MKQTKTKNNYAMLPVIFSLAWPTMLEQLMQTAVQYIDTAMVGALGTHATAAVGSTTTINWLLSSSLSALGIGFLSFIARAYGAGNKEHAAKVVTQAVLATLVSGAVITILALSLSGMIPKWMQVDPAIQSLASTYFFILYIPMLPRAATIIFGTALRAAGDTKTPMRVGIIVNVINIILNFLLIFPTHHLQIAGLEIVIPSAGLGVVGAAIASAIAFATGGLYMTRALWKHPVLSPKGQKLSVDMQILRPCLKVALPNMMQRFGTSLGYVAFASMVNSLGEISTAAHTIANTVESAFYIPGYGMQTAAATLAGNALGANDNKKMKEFSHMIIWVEVILMIISGSLLFIFAPSMMGIFTKDPEVIKLGSTVLRMVAVSEPFYGVSIIIEGMMLGVGETVTPFKFNILGMWGIRIVGTFICTQLLNMTLVSAWGCMISHNMLLFLLFLIHYKRGHWNPLNRIEAELST